MTTSGAYGYRVGKSLAMALIDPKLATAGQTVMIHIVGEERTAKVIADSPYDPTGGRMRA